MKTNGSVSWLHTPIDVNTWTRRFFLLYLIGISISHMEIHPYIKIGVITWSIAGLVLDRLAQKPVFWLGMAVIMLVNMVFRYTLQSNHYFLAFYCTLALLFEALHQERNTRTGFNYFQGLLVMAFGLAAIQKLLSPYFLSGKLIGSYILSGGSFYYTFEKWVPGFQNVVVSFRELVESAPQGVADSTRALPSSIFSLDGTILPQLPAGPDFITLCIIISWAILLIEVAVLSSLWNKRWFQSNTAAYGLLLFVWLAMTFRYEYAFYSLLLILFLLGAKKMQAHLRILYFLSIGIFMSMDLIGFKLSF